MASRTKRRQMASAEQLAAIAEHAGKLFGSPSDGLAILEQDTDTRRTAWTAQGADRLIRTLLSLDRIGFRDLPLERRRHELRQALAKGKPSETLPRNRQEWITWTARRLGLDQSQPRPCPRCDGTGKLTRQREPSVSSVLTALTRKKGATARQFRNPQLARLRQIAERLDCDLDTAAAFCQGLQDD